MYLRIALSLMTASLMATSVLLAGCAAAPEPGPSTSPPDEMPAESPAPPADGGAAGLRLAPGLYDLEDGTAQALGTLEYQEIEGGFWALTGAAEAGDDTDSIIAVISNSAQLDAQLKPLEGKTVMITGKRLDGASVRMSGPEVEVTQFEEISDTPGIAE